MTIASAEEMVCVCGHDFKQHPIEANFPFAWRCIAPLCHCEEWQEMRYKAKKLPVDIWDGL